MTKSENKYFSKKKGIVYNTVCSALADPTSFSQSPCTLVVVFATSIKSDPLFSVECFLDVFDSSL